MPDEQRKVWRPGNELSTWPELKYVRALQHLRDLQSRVELWSSSGSVSSEKVIAQDLRSIDIRLRVKSEPPTLEWALVLGDAIHNLRSALDAVTWEFAHINGATPSKPKQIYFPICVTEAEWNQKKLVLQTIPPEALERFRLVQPFLYANGDRSVLALLTRLSNQDKHRSFVKCTAEIGGLEAVDWTLQFDDEDGVPEPPFLLHPTPEADLQDGALLLRISSSSRFKNFEARSNLRVNVRLELDDERLALEHIVNTLTFQVRGVLDILYRGIEEPPGNEGGNWLPIHPAMVQPIQPSTGPGTTA